VLPELSTFAVIKAFPLAPDTIDDPPEFEFPLLLLLFDPPPFELPEVVLCACFCCPGATKSPIQLPNTLTTVTTNLPPPVMLLLTKLTRFAMTLTSPVLIFEFPPVLKFVALPPVFAVRFKLFCILASLL